MIISIASFVGGAAKGEFQRGHIFVAVSEPESCDFGGREWIIEVDPVTGAWSVFADSDDGICVVSGLRFTPNGKRLLAVNAGHIGKVFDGGWIQAFDQDGTSQILLDASDGLYQPVGSNALAFDAEQNLFIVNAGNNRILRFPSDGGSATVFADRFDGIDDRGALEFALNGDLFYSGELARKIIRIDASGQSRVFDDIGGFSALGMDHQGNLFAASRGGGVYRYEGPSLDVNTRTLFVQGFRPGSGIAIAFSPDDSRLYLAETRGRVYAVDTATAVSTLLADFTEISPLAAIPLGMAVYVPFLAGDIDQDGDLDLLDFAAWQRCWTGSAATFEAPICARADLNDDEHVKETDVTEFVSALTGP